MSMRPLDPNNVLIKLLVTFVMLFIFIGLVGCSSPTKIDEDNKTISVPVRSDEGSSYKSIGRDLIGDLL